jgi:hypothetical protein
VHVHGRIAFQEFFEIRRQVVQADAVDRGDADRA